MSRNGRPVITKFSEDVDSLNYASMTASNEYILEREEMKGEEDHVYLTWRSWLVVLVTCFAQMAQVFVVAGSGQNIAFIARDLGDASLAGWIIRKCSCTFS